MSTDQGADAKQIHTHRDGHTREGENREGDWEDWREYCIATGKPLISSETLQRRDPPSDAVIVMQEVLHHSCGYFSATTFTVSSSQKTKKINIIIHPIHGHKKTEGH